MRVLVVAHRMELGGTQVNSIDLANKLRHTTDLDIVFAATPGPAGALARDSGLEIHPLPDAAGHPSRARVGALNRLADEVRPDFVHVWDWPQCFDAYPGLHVGRGIPMLCTEMGMVVPRFIPRHLSTTFGTVELAERARRMRSGPVHLLEPPVDLEANRPGVVSGADFRTRVGADPDTVLIGMVCRLESWLKMESLQRGIAAVEDLARTHLVKLVIVGEGSAAEVVARRAAEANARLGREIVVLTGGIVDPRPAYEAADIMIGMGGSALRAMAFGTPLVVVGQRGFSRVLDDSTLPLFLYKGWYGLGSGEWEDLAGQLARLINDTVERKQLGKLGLTTVRDRYDLDIAAQTLEKAYRETAAGPVPRARAVAEGGRTVVLRAARATQQTGARIYTNLTKEKP